MLARWEGVVKISPTWRKVVSALSDQQLSAYDTFGEPAFSKKKQSRGSLLFDLWGGVSGSLSPGWSKDTAIVKPPEPQTE